MNPDLLIIIILLAANAFFVAAEFSLVKAKGVRLEGLAGNGSRPARLAVNMRNKMDHYLAACQLGITMASLGLGWVGEPAVEALLAPLFSHLPLPHEMLHTTSFLIGFLLFSSLHIVIGEQVPKTFAIRNPEPVSVLIAYPLHLFYLLMLPLNQLLRLATTGILAIFRVPAATHEDVFSSDELQSLVDVSRDHGELHKDKADMLSNLFAFDSGITRDVMVPVTKVDFLNLRDATALNIERITGMRHSRFPVIDGDINSVVGVLLVKDLINAILQGCDIHSLNLREFCRDVSFVPELMSANELFESMRTNRTHMSIVVDEYGAVSGLITMEDLLEEIVGEIADEMDENESEFPIEQLNEHSWAVHGLISLTQLYKQTGFKAEQTDATTVSGLFMQCLGKLPEADDTLTETPFTLTVSSVADRSVELAILTKTQSDHPEVTA